MNTLWRIPILLRARTIETDTAEQIRVKPKELHEFQSAFVPPKRFNFSSKQIDKLKVKAAIFHSKKFEAINLNPGQANQIPRQGKQRKDLTKWTLPNLFVTNRILALGFSFVEESSNPDR
jgi:hypothetical protein